MAGGAFTFFRYLPVSETDKQWGLYATTVGTSCCPPRAAYPPGQHPRTHHFSPGGGRALRDFQAIFITRGQGSFESASVAKQSIRAGHLFILFPGEWHRYSPDASSGWDEHWVGFDGGYARHLYKRGLLSSRKPVFHMGLDSELVTSFGRAVELVKLEPIGYQQILAALVLDILGRTQVAGSLEEVQQHGRASLVREVKLYLAEHLNEQVDLKAFSAHLGVSYSVLRQTFKAHTGFSPHSYQLELRLAHAKELLKGTNLPVKRVASKLGFENAFYFSRFFKSRAGLAPEHWRHPTQGVQKTRRSRA